MRIAGVVLIIIGIICLIIGGITYTRNRKSVSLGPLTATVTQKETIPIPPIIGGIALIGGIVLVVASGRRTS